MKDISRYFLEDVQEGIEGKYSDEQLEFVLSKRGYDHYPIDGLTDRGHRTLLKDLSKLDERQSNLKKVKRKDLSSKVVEARVDVKKEGFGNFLMEGIKFNLFIPEREKELYGYKTKGVVSSVIIDGIAGVGVGAIVGASTGIINLAVLGFALGTVYWFIPMLVEASKLTRDKPNF